jgi:hypothetical protein
VVPNQSDSLIIYDQSAGSIKKIPLLSVLGNVYYPDYHEADQGATGDGTSVKAIVDAVGTDENATLIFLNNSGGDTTSYVFSTDETIPDNYRVLVDKGAIFSVANTKTLTMGQPPLSSPSQIFYGAGTVAITDYPQDRVWWGDDQRIDTTNIKTGDFTVVEDDGETTHTMTEFFKTIVDDDLPVSVRNSISATKRNLQDEYAVASGTDTYTVSLTNTITGYTTGAHFFITFTNANTVTTPTLDIDSVGALTIVKDGTTALEVGDICAGHSAILKYDGTYLVLLNPYRPSGARVYTNSYTGDGGTEHAITGVGFSPKWIFLVNHATSSIEFYFWFYGIPDGYSFRFYGADIEYRIINDAITVIGSDGFTVSDGGADEHPNKNGIVYDFICIGK